MEFTYDKYRRAALSGLLGPPTSSLPLITVDRLRLEKLRKKRRPIELEQLRCRLDEETYARVRGGLALSLRSARRFFPAYSFYVAEFLNDEWLSMVDWHKPFHRDHLIHQPMCAYTGMSLLTGRELSAADGELLPGEMTLLERAVKLLVHSPTCRWLQRRLEALGGPRVYFDKGPLAEMLWENLFLSAFYLAALYHDIGYPWQFLSNIHDRLSPHYPLVNPSLKGAGWLLKEYGKRLVFAPLHGYSKPDPARPPHRKEEVLKIISEGLEKTHGVPGAITMLYLNDVICENPSINIRPAGRFILEWAAMAVMAHDLGNVYAKVKSKDDDGTPLPGGPELKVRHPELRVSFVKEPLSFMLTLTDQVQGFARPDATFRSIPGGSVASFHTRSYKTGVELINDELTITHHYSNQGDYYNNRTRFLPEAELQYFDRHEGYLDYSATGIKKISLRAAI